MKIWTFFFVVFTTLTVHAAVSQESSPHQILAEKEAYLQHLTESREALAGSQNLIWLGNNVETAQVLPESAVLRMIESAVFYLNVTGVTEATFDAYVKRLPFLSRLALEAAGWETTTAMAINDGTERTMTLLREQSTINQNQVLAELDNDKAQATIDEEDRETAKQGGGPNLDRIYASTYGDIHWKEGYYGSVNKTISVGDFLLTENGVSWVMVGTWGRANDDDYSGSFEFVFTDPCNFSGWWWKNGKTKPTSKNWTGSCKP